MLIAIRRAGAAGSDDYPVDVPDSPPTADTEFTGGLGQVEDVRPGMRLAVEGWRFVNCVVQATRITLLP